ncbi:hypothetical protein [Aureisphaera sp.]
MRKIVLPVLILLLVLYVSCEESKKDDHIPVKVIAFCDMTSSLDSLSIYDESNKVVKFINALPWGSELTVYPINDNTFSNNFFHYEIPQCNTNIERKIKELEDQRSKFADSLGRYIVENHDRTIEVSVDEFRSCIVSSLETAYQLLKTLNNRGNIRLVFFSDMIEQCPISSYGKMYMCSNNVEPKKEKLIKQIEDNYTPNFNLKNLIDNRISIVISTNKRRQENCLQEYERKALWQKIFEKIGYSKEDFESFHYNQELPNW